MTKRSLMRKTGHLGGWTHTRSMGPAASAEAGSMRGVQDVARTCLHRSLAGAEPTQSVVRPRRARCRVGGCRETRMGRSAVFRPVDPDGAERSVGRRSRSRVVRRCLHHLQGLRAWHLRTHHEGGGAAPHHRGRSRADGHPQQDRIVRQLRAGRQQRFADGGPAEPAAGRARQLLEGPWAVRIRHASGRSGRSDAAARSISTRRTGPIHNMPFPGWWCRPASCRMGR
ncbi:hypothetical protein ACVWZK_003641 [Bradyrhizobium sp. GM0.4]